MDEHNNLTNRIKGLTNNRKSHSASSILRIIRSADFQEVKKHWFTLEHTKSIDTVPPDYSSEVSDYTLTAINLYENAVEHKSINYIRLNFYQDISLDKIQPQIDIQFDSGLYHIDIGLFWDDEIGLERERKKECQTMAETIWYEYKTENHQGTILLLAERVKEIVTNKYPDIEVRYEIK